jgi:hypothetical protein
MAAPMPAQMPDAPLSPRPPQVLPPASRRGDKLLRQQTHWFDDENLDIVAHVLDDWLRIPGTSIRFGLDGIVGLIPGIGDVVGGLASLVILFAGWVRGVPYITLIRMVANVGISVIVGAVPIAGDMFDIAWKANRRNYKLMTRHLAQPHRHKWKDWAFLLCLAALLMAIFLAPIFLLIAILEWLHLHQ